MRLFTVMLVLLLIQDVTYILTLRAAKQTSLGSNARRFVKLVGINKLINWITIIAFTVIFISAVIALIAGWNVGINTFFPTSCPEWNLLMSSNINWVLYRNAFVAFVVALPMQYVRAILDPLVHIAGSRVIRKSMTFGLLHSRNNSSTRRMNSCTHGISSSIRETTR